MTDIARSPRPAAPAGARAAILLDRDGTLIVERHYLHDPAGVELEQGAGPALSSLVRAGWPLVVLSNQSGIGRGLFAREAADAVNARVAELLEPFGVRVEGWYMCPHTPDDACDCRKPRTGLARRAAEELQLDLGRSWMIGDKLSDVAMAQAIGARSILVVTGHGWKAAQMPHDPATAICANLDEAARVIARDARP